MADDPLIGTEIAGRFRITQRLGEGSVGEVYLAEHALIGRSFAIKLLKQDYRTNSTVTERFRREALVASRLDHRHIVTISDFGTAADGRLFLVMEYVDGPSLGRAIEERLPGVIPLRRAMTLLGQIAQGLAAAHDAGVVHRDLKPENILIASTRTGEVVKILDFGLAKLMVDAEPLVLTRRGQLFGTPMYMSPEQAKGEELDSRTDIYAFGAVAYEVLTGRPLFQTEALDVLLRKIQEEMPPAPSTVQPFGSLPIPPELDALVLACLAKDREARPLRISAVGGVLERCLGELRRPSGALIPTAEYDRLELAELQQLGQEARAMTEARASATSGQWPRPSAPSGPKTTEPGGFSREPARAEVARTPSIQVTTFVELDTCYWRRICKAAVGLARYLEGRGLLGPETARLLADLAQAEERLIALEDQLVEPRRRLALVEQTLRDREAQLRHAVIDLSLERGRVAESDETDPQHFVDLDFQIRMLEQRLAEVIRRGRLDRADVEPPVQGLEAQVEKHLEEQQEVEVQLLGALRRERPASEAAGVEVTRAFAQLEELVRDVG